MMERALRESVLADLVATESYSQSALDEDLALIQAEIWRL